MPDKLEIKQVPAHIVQAFVAKYGKIGQPLDETDWLELFGAWRTGWLAAEKHMLARFDQASVHPDFRGYATANTQE